MDKAALRGEPSYVWRAGQERRLQMIIDAAGDRIHGRIMEDGCGVGMYMQHLLPSGGSVTGLDFDFERVAESHALGLDVVNAAGEHLPYPDDHFDLVMSNEVIEHVQDDRLAVQEMVQGAQTGRTVGVVLPQYRLSIRDSRYLPEWKVSFRQYSAGQLPAAENEEQTGAARARLFQTRPNILFRELPVIMIQQTVIFGGYDNIIARLGAFGRLIRRVMQGTGAYSIALVWTQPLLGG